jgi:hypothetical protein
MAFSHLDGRPLERALGVEQTAPTSAAAVDAWLDAIGERLR